MSQPDIFDDVIACLQQIKRRGRRRLDLRPETVEALFGPAPAAASEDAADATPEAQRERLRNAAPPPGPAGAAATPTAEIPAGWEGLAAAVAGCRRCRLHAGRTQTVFGEGARNAAVMFVGEGPGEEEDRTGRPFVGLAGGLLTRMIAAMQFSREEVYIANIVKCRPPGNRTPQPDEAAACLPYLLRQIELIKPKVLVLLGAVPLRYVMRIDGITRVHGQWMEFGGIPCLPTYHPAYLLRSPQMKKESWEDLQKVMQRLGRDPAETMRRLRERKA
ncbi:MAG: Uracil DNA glycosylase superfamily protein [Lentisphaerae bacterium ADurb.BinA184]|nr:MAG: Uracil DNA glycosylase superfamily protein [Lentisphaerae bacterium ADurb.BinA184]